MLVLGGSLLVDWSLFLGLFHYSELRYMHIIFKIKCIMDLQRFFRFIFRATEFYLTHIDLIPVFLF